MRKVIGIPLALYFLWFMFQNYIGLNSSSSEDSAVEQDLRTDIEIELDRKSYIHKYLPVAVREMHRSGIPASITLAQGLLESRYGTSKLAREAHNHFGIKCGKNWEGDKFCAPTHEWNPKTQSMIKQLGCFRWYASAEESFRNHSDFLMHRDRYAFLFQYSQTNYEAWAKGLQKAGYATDPKYAVKLLSLIQQYQLGQYDIDYKIIRLPL
ncbi:MAG: glucosaminidase domain-containing protein [Saprospiraceae bacterium]|nr:glucosaminidase domain-containing protein [Saprospiraceae bacterium]